MGTAVVHIILFAVNLPTVGADMPEPEQNGPIPVGGNVKAPQKIFAPQPRYPEMARRAGKYGTAIIQAVINRQGEVTKVSILKDLGFGLGQAAADAIAS